VLEDNTTIGRGARLCGQSALAAGRQIPDNQIWDGAPARPSNQTSAPLPARPQISSVGWWAVALSSAATAVVVSVLFFLPAFPAFVLIDKLGPPTGNAFDSQLGPLAAFGVFFLFCIPASLLFIGVTMLVTAGLRWSFPRQVVGISSIYSLAFWRKRFVTSLLDSSTRTLHGLYASVYTPMWLRLMGATVGRHAEISTAEALVPELLQMGDDTFVRDDAVLGDEEVRGGWMILKSTHIGTRSFIGNGAYVPDGTAVPDDVLIGVLTRAPRNDQLASGQTWLGSPPLLLPAREVVTGFPDSLTFRPSLRRRWSRGLVKYYGCSFHLNRAPEVCGNSRLVRREMIEARLLQVIQTKILSQESVAYLTKQANEALKNAHTVKRGQQERLHREVYAAEVELENIKSAIRKGIITPSAKAMLEEAEEKLDQFRAKLNPPNDLLGKPLTVLPTAIERYLKELGAVLNRDADRSRKLLQQLIPVV
jgi:carbonic anhydrase/acetyltransferase-like protein (isoleucine patch superfamily)